MGQQDHEGQVDLILTNLNLNGLTIIWLRALKKYITNKTSKINKIYITIFF